MTTAVSPRQRLPGQTIETESPLTDREHRAVSGARSSVHEEGGTASPDAQAGGGAMPGHSMGNRDDTRALSTTYQNGHGNYVVSPTPSLCRARARAQMITGTSGLSHFEQPQTQGGVRNQDVHGNGHLNEDSRRDFRGYESPFSRRVREKTRQVQAHSEDPPRGRSKRTTELPSSAKNAERGCGPEIQGDAFFHRTLMCPQHLALNSRTPVSSAGAIGYHRVFRGQRRGSVSDQAAPRAHRQDKVVDGPKKA